MFKYKVSQLSKFYYMLNYNLSEKFKRIDNGPHYAYIKMIRNTYRNICTFLELSNFNIVVDIKSSNNTQLVKTGIKHWLCLHLIINIFLEATGLYSDPSLMVVLYMDPLAV